MESLNQFAGTFLSWWLAAYAGMAGTYLVAGWILTQSNKRLTRYRIQSKRSSPALARRDFYQSLRSLITISALFAGGLTLRGMGIGPATAPLTILNSILYLVVSFVLRNRQGVWRGILAGADPNSWPR